MAETVDTCYNLYVGAIVSTPSAVTAFTNWFCKDCIVPICAKE